MNSYRKQSTAQKILTFRKWGRKNYSVFTTIRQIIRISVLSVIYFLFSPIVHGNDKDTVEVKMKYNLDEIEVSAQRSPALYSQVARIISVIEKTEIEKAPSQSIQELLEYVAGVDVRQRGSEGVQADISIRGSTFDQILILLNGINITDPQTGHHNLNLPVSLNQIERIEILEGPAARIYGPNAFAGAINIITQKADSNSIQTDISAGSFKYANYGISGNFGGKKSGHSISATHKKSQGYIDNTDFKNSTVFYSCHFQNKKGKWFAQAGYLNKQFGANSFYTPKYPNQFEHTKTLFSSIKWNSNSSFHFTPALYYRQHNDRFELFRNNPPAWYSNHNYHLTRVFGGNVNSWKQWKAGKTSLGMEFRSENILSNVLGEPLENHIAVPGEEAQFSKSKSRIYYSSFVEHIFYLGNLSFSGGMLANYIPENNIGVKLFPGFDISYKLNKWGKLYVSWNSSLRLPTFTDLYYKGPANIGNPGLKPEESATLETGFKLQQKFIKGHLLVFSRKGSNIIDWVKQENDEVWQPRNLTEINNTGLELFLQFLPQEKWGHPLPEKISVSYVKNSMKKNDFDFISNYVLDHLNYKLVLQYQHKIGKRFYIDIRSVFQDREGTFTGFKNGSFGSEIEYAPFGLIDAKLSYSAKNMLLFVMANNIFNTKYYDVGNVLQPGTWIKTGLHYRINFKN